MIRNERREVGIATAILLHFVPAVAIATTYVLLARLVTQVGLPRVSALLAAFAFVGIPLQLGILRYAARAAGHPVVRNREPMPLWQHAAGAVVLIAAVLLLLLQLPLERLAQHLATHAFAWVPPELGPSADGDLARTGRNLLLPILLLQLLIDGIVNPIVEERYFRGFLLPQLDSLGAFAPVLNTLLFASAHFWQPHNVVTIFVCVLPLTFFTWWRRNYSTQAFVHCFANSFGAALALVASFG